jgi:copper transport protein
MVAKCGVVAALAITFLIALPLRAAAHAELLDSQPLNGARLGLAPATVVLTFSEALYPALSDATVTDPGNRALTAAPTSASEIRVGLLTNLPGVYHVTWHAVSAADGHATHGSLSFTVEAISDAVAANPSSGGTGLGLVIAIARWIEDGALLLAFGMFFVLWLARRGSPLAWVRPPLLPPVLVALVAGLVVIGGEAVAADGVSASGVVAFFASGPAGEARVARVLAELLACAAVALRLRVAWLALPLALAALAASGHAAGAPVPWLSFAVDTGHLLAAGVWVGAIMAMATLRPQGGWHVSGPALLARFTPWALVGFAASVGLGAVQAVTNVGDASALLTTSYGRLLILKALGVIAIIPLSVLAWRQRRVHMRAEALIGVMVVGAAALLASFPVPARSGTFGAAAVPVVAALPRGTELTLGGEAGQTLVGLTVDPAVPGTNRLTVYVSGAGGATTQNVDVTAQINGQDVPLRSCGSTCRYTRVELMGGEGISLRVAGAQGGTAGFHMPALPAADGAALLTAALARMGGLHSVALHETLTGGAGTTITTDYREVAPDLLEWAQPGGAATVVVGAIRYTRPGARDPWTVETGNPTVSEPAFSWELFSPDIGVHVVGTAMVGAVRTTEVAFFAGVAGTPVWFRFYVDDHLLVRRADMVAPGHFMTQTFAAFDAPLRIATTGPG